MKLLSGKAASVTGSSRGIGAAISRLLADQGVEALRQHVEENLGPIAILVANAGGSFTMPGPIEEISEEGWHAFVDGNLTATFLTINSVLPGMKQRRAGNIITTASSAGRRPHSEAPISLFLGEGRDTDSDSSCCRAGRPIRHSSERHRCGGHPHRPKSREYSGITARVLGRGAPHQATWRARKTLPRQRCFWPQMNRLG